MDERRPSLLWHVAAATMAVLLACAPSTAASPRVWFVDNSKGSAGAGSIDAPLQTLEDAASASGPGDWIFVFAGNGSTRGYDNGMQLKPGQHLIGEASGLVVDGVTIVPKGSAPLITNGNGIGIRMADDSAVSGIAVTSANGSGIEAKGVRNVRLEYVSVSDSNGDAISLHDVAGAASLRHVSVDGGTSGVSVSMSKSSQATVRLRNCELSGVDRAAVRCRASDRASMSIEVRNCSLKNGGTGIDLAVQDAARLEYSITKNKAIEDFAGTLISLFVDTGTTPEALLHGIIADNPKLSKTPGAGFGIRASCNGKGRLAATITNNTIAGGITQDAGIWAEARLGTGRLDIILENNRISVTEHALEPIVLQARGESVVCARLQANVVSPVPGQAGLNIRQRDNSTLAVAGLKHQRNSAESVAALLRSTNPGLSTVSATAETTFQSLTSTVCEESTDA